MFTSIKLKYRDLLSDTQFSEILNGAIWTFASRILSTLLGLGFSVFVSRLYGADGLGLIAVIDSFLILITIFTVLGTETSILSLLPEHLTKHSPSSALQLYRKIKNIVISVSLVAGVLCFFSADFIAYRIFSKPHLSYYIMLASGTIVFKSMMLISIQAIRALRLIRVFAIMSFLPQSFALVILAVLTICSPSEGVPVYALLGGFWITGTIAWFVLKLKFREHTNPTDSIHNLNSREILSTSLPMLMSNAMEFFIGQTGVLVIGMFHPDAEVGRYAIAVKIAMLTAFILQAVNSMAGPKFAELYHSGNMDELFRVAKKSTKLIVFLTFPVLITLLFFGKNILTIVFGSDFAVAYPALVLLVAGQFVNAASGLGGIFLNMTGNQHGFRNIVLVAAILNVVLTFSLTPHFGINGTAFAAMLSICFWNVATLLFIKIKYGQSIGYLPLNFMRHRP
jgi:O-antigen/teichoic acid export membrane protein